MNVGRGGQRNDVAASLQAPGRWHASTSMHEAREGHTATLLPDGRVLVTGGDLHGARFLASCELYDPCGMSWQRAAPLATPRAAHTATLLEDGCVLVAGGVNSWGTVASAEAYDPTVDAWSERATLCTQRSGHAAVRLAGGLVLCTGGMNLGRMPPAHLSSVELYDPILDLWDGAASMRWPRAGHSATVLDDTTVLVVGGNGPGGPSGAAEVYRARSDTWESIEWGEVVCGCSTATPLGQGRVLVAGGSACGVQDPGHAGVAPELRPADRTAALYCHGTRRLRLVPEMAVGRQHHAATLLADGGVLVTGGSNGGSRILDDTEIHDPVTAAWACAGHLGTPRMFHTGTLLPTGDVLVAGGLSRLGATLSSLDSAEIFSPVGRG
jgi:hypothetical protein